MSKKTVTANLLLAVGLVLLAIYGFARIYSHISSHLAIAEIKDATKSAATAPTKIEPKPVSSPVQRELHLGSVSFALWDTKRIREYRETLEQRFPPVQGVLSISKVGIEAPLYDGTDDLTLNRGVGRIIGTKGPGETGNMGVAGHRDGFFRGLKDIQTGDTVQLQTRTATYKYAVESIKIVSPTDVSVLEDGSSPELTLVTCYPFYFIGDAPKRYIVRCALKTKEEFK